jgi:hypothetical protein
VKEYETNDTTCRSDLSNIHFRNYGPTETPLMEWRNYDSHMLFHFGCLSGLSEPLHPVPTQLFILFMMNKLQSLDIHFKIK